MPSHSDTTRFLCSFCEQSFKITTAYIGRRIECHKCKRAVWIYPNRDQSIDSQLASYWRYKKLRLVFGHDVIGPIPSEQFLALHAAGKISTDTDVSSPEFTRDQWVELSQVNVPLIKARVDQRAAERKREAAARKRRQEIVEVNRNRLAHAISSAIADGHVTFRERNQLIDFASRANIPASEVEELLQHKARQLVHDVVEDALGDGVLEPHEHQRIGELATGLGIQLDLTPEQHHRLHLCDLAYRLAVGTFVPDIEVDRTSHLTGRESALHTARFEWFEIVQLKRAAGIPLGGDHYLRSIATGECMLTDKRVILIGELASRKFNLSSVAKIRRFSDGVLFNRSAGKSVFLRQIPPVLACDQWAMLAVHAVTREPVQGTQPTACFIPALKVESPSEKNGRVSYADIDEPRFTFRVVGDHVGDRGYWIERVKVGTPIHFEREPHNPHDRNAVAVFDASGRQLGYLKRDVAVWFAPMLDRGRRFKCDAYRKPSSGGLIVGVYEDAAG